MNLYVFDKQFNMLGLLDQFTSLIWRREYQKIGTFEFHGFVDDSFHLLQKGHILMKDDSPEEAMEIDTIELSEDGSETLVVKGFAINKMLDLRLVWGVQEKEGTVEEVMKDYVNRNCIEPANPARIIPNLVLSENKGYEIPASESNSYVELASFMEELAVKYDIGWRMLFDHIGQRYVFDVYKGRDLSINQTANPQAIFSMEYENVINQFYTDSDTSYKTMAVIGGQGEDSDQFFAYLNDTLTGFDRREVYVDGKEVPMEDETGYILTDELYAKGLEERGKLELAERNTIRTFESDVSANSNLTYREDYDLGDIVTVENRRWGIAMSAPITTVEEVYENNVMDIRVNFGSAIPTLIDKIKRKVR